MCSAPPPSAPAADADVRGLVKRSRALVLTLDRSVPTPFHRFALARFTEDPIETLAPVHRAHRMASTLAWALPGPIGALAAALPPSELVGGALGRASVALLVAIVAGVSMRGLAAWLAWGGPASDRLREAFETAVSERLGLLPPPLQAPVLSAEAVLRRAATSPLAAEARARSEPKYLAPKAIDTRTPEAHAVPWARLMALAGVGGSVAGSMSE